MVPIVIISDALSLSFPFWALQLCLNPPCVVSCGDRHNAFHVYKLLRIFNLIRGPCTKPAAQTHGHMNSPPAPPFLDIWLTDERLWPVLLHLQQRHPESHGFLEPTDSPAHRFRQGGAGREDKVWCHSSEGKVAGGGGWGASMTGWCSCRSTSGRPLFSTSPMPSFHQLKPTLTWIYCLSQPLKDLSPFSHPRPWQCLCEQTAVIKIINYL